MELGQQISLPYSGVRADWALQEGLTPIMPGEEFSQEDGLKSLSGRLEISVSDEWQSPVEIILQSSHNIVISGESKHTITSPNDIVVEFELYFTQPPEIEDVDVETIDIRVGNDSERTTLSLKIPTSWTLNAAIQIINADPAHAVKKVCDLYDVSAGEETVLSIRNAGYRPLPYDQFLDLLRRLQAVDVYFDDVWKRHHGASFFRNQILGKTSPYSISSWTELDSKVETYDEYDRLDDVTIDEILRNVLSSLHSDNEPRDYFFETFDIGQAGEYITTVDTAVYVLAWACHKQDFKAARTLINDWPAEISSIEDYHQHKQRAQNADWSTASNRWLELLPEAAERSQAEFNYVVGKYLSCVSISKGLDRLFVKEVSVDLLQEVGAERAAQYTQYNAYMEQGFDRLYRDNAAAAESFEKALDVANNTSGLWPAQIHSQGMHSLVHLTIAEAQQRYEEGRVKDGIELLETRINAIEDLSDVNEEAIDDFTTKLEAEQYSLSAGKHLREGEFDIANSALGEAIKNYNHLNLDDPAKYLITQKDQLRAFLAERDSNFETAASWYDRLASNVESRLGGDGTPYRIRRDICRTKQAILQEQYNDARDELTITDEDEHFASETHQLSEIITLLKDYNRNELSNLTAAFKYGQDGRDEGPLGIKYQADYTDAICVIGGAQRLNQLFETSDWLDELIRVAIENIFIPRISSLTNMVSPTSEHSTPVIQEFTLESYRLQLLPRHVAEQVEKAEMNRVTNAMDYTEAGGNLTKAIEFYLEVVAEYYGKFTWGDDWKQHLGQGQEKLSLGHFVQLFREESREHLHDPDTAEELLDEPIVEDKSIVQVRNDYHGHGNDPHFEEDSYNRLKEHATQIFDHLLEDTPIIAKIIEQSELGHFTAELYWNHSPQRIFLTSSKDLGQDGYYYLPRSSVDGIVAKPQERIVECEESRIHNNLNDLSIARQE